MFNRFINVDEAIRLPFSSNKYKIEISGRVLNVKGEVVQPSFGSLGELVVAIDWFDGFREYALSEVIAHTFKPIKLPLKWWSKVTVLFADGDNKNLHPSNLVWKFPVGLGSDTCNGFSFIPMYSRYMINRDGVLFDTRSNRILNAHFNKGYYSYVLMPDIGPRTCLKRHRALCLAFTDYPNNVDSMTVNHKNGVAGDDRLENLEWATSSENRIHAIKNGLTLINKPVIVRNLLTGVETEYFSLKQVCEKLKCSESKVSRYLGQQEGSFVVHNLELRYKNPEHAFIGNANKCSILVRDLRTGEVSEYDSIVSCAAATGKTKYLIASRIETPTSNLYEDCLQFKRKSDPSPWYIPENYEQEILETSWSKRVLVKSLKTDTVLEFETQRLAADHLGISESTIVKWLGFTGQPVFKHGKKDDYVLVKRKSVIGPWREVKDPEKELMAKSCLKIVQVKNIENNTVREFQSAVECAKEIGILPTTLNWRLKSKGQKVYEGNLLFKYKEDFLDFKTFD